MLRREDGFTLLELIVVVTIISILVVIAVGFHQLARDKAADATARSNIRIAIPAIEAYQADNGSYAGMTLANLQSTYSPGVQGIEVLSGDAAGYCVRSTVGASSWYKAGPGRAVTTTACS